MSNDDGLTPAQLRGIADRIRGRYRPPSPAMEIGLYVVAEGMQAFAWALDDLAAAEEQP
jgi:hypothetical protein